METEMGVISNDKKKKKMEMTKLKINIENQINVIFIDTW